MQSVVSQLHGQLNEGVWMQLPLLDGRFSKRGEGVAHDLKVLGLRWHTEKLLIMHLFNETIHLSTTLGFLKAHRLQILLFGMMNVPVGFFIQSKQQLLRRRDLPDCD